ncbi:helix-turn-helix domain-containing protein [Bacillus timonensis]|uniref:helix-turn-helix domain-containing protein n=1 Tax=Bacillus timonensis TaxID=1033734 RepID=UPI000289D5A1|nr:helix-turn-helix domain-containing protein [Bacillus timonensis]
METSFIISTALKLHYLTDLNIYVLNQEGQFSYRQELFELPSFMRETHETIIAKLSQVEEEQVYNFNYEWDLQFLCYSLKVQGLKLYILLGPYYEMAPDFYKLTREHQLSHNQSEALRDVAKKIPIVTGEKTNSFASVLQHFRRLMENDATTQIIVSNAKNQDLKNTNNTDAEEVELVQLRYEIEKNFLRAVENGDKKQALQLISSNNPLFSFAERFPNQPIRRVKNNLIVMNTLLRTAARNSKVPSIMVHRISEGYAFKIEQASKLGKLYQIEDQMIGEYCDLVQSNTLKQFSIMIQKVIEHITNYYDQPLRIETLAEKVETHASHLSRKFKEETGYTITSYQQMLRINQAKYLLKSEKLSIEEISWLVGYDDPSYFTRVFKKESGMTPTQYRQ